ncbi:MAG: DNA/RNA non-specific endonuclease [Chitinophagaceae bacterium]|nr:DNA/RNA non-specific endonuclease [Chitinophagaceae bacterium]
MKFRLSLFAIVVLVLAGCKKDPPAPPAPAVASFTINCAAVTVQGTYTGGLTLNNTNTITVPVNVTQVGTYSVSTATINGITFSGSGSFSTTGKQSITLQGTGIPVNNSTYFYLISAGAATCSFPVSIITAPSGNFDNDHMLFGNPSRAATIIDSTRNYLLRKQYYALSYNKDRGTPNWVSWHLFQNDLGSTSRQDDFRTDNTLPAGWYQVPANAFSGSGFDRGHNCPSGDRTSSVDANSSTFLMTNMIPQAPVMNQGIWANMEDSLRRLVNQGNEIYIIMGSYGTGGTGNNGPATTVNGGNVTVPSTVWKVALVLPNGNNDSSRVDNNTRLIAVNIANSNSSTGSWKNYRTSVDAIEAATGYDLLDRLAPVLQGVIEARVDNL